MNTAATCTAPTLEECKVIELRQYTLKPRGRETLIRLFDTCFIEPQEEAGMRVIGQFRDLGNEDKFVWLRGFADMDARRRGLEAFYFGPVWARNRNEANATMIDSDDVLLLRPAWAGSALCSPGAARASTASSVVGGQRVMITVFHLREPAAPELLAVARVELTAVLVANLAAEVGWYASHSVENTFPKLPVRENEHVLVAIARFPDDECFAHVMNGDAWSSVRPMLRQWEVRPAQALFLAPTSRSLFAS